jgi:hypothetical protein
MEFIQELRIQALISIFIYSEMKKRDSQRYHLVGEESILHSKINEIARLRVQAD